MHGKTKKIDGGFLLQFAADDFRNKYAGSIMGVTWAFVQPLMTIVIYWFIFQVGFHSQPVADYPFILWLVSGIIPWFFISEGIVGATPALAEYSYLVKKVVFPIEILPLTKILSFLRHLPYYFSADSDITRIYIICSFRIICSI